MNVGSNVKLWGRWPAWSSWPSASEELAWSRGKLVSKTWTRLATCPGWSGWDEIDPKLAFWRSSISVTFDFEKNLDWEKRSDVQLVLLNGPVKVESLVDVVADPRRSKYDPLIYMSNPKHKALHQPDTIIIPPGSEQDYYFFKKKNRSEWIVDLFTFEIDNYLVLYQNPTEEDMERLEVW